MSFRRVFIPVAMFLTLMLQFVPGTVFAPRPVAAQPCNMAQFIADETIPDGTVVAPGSTFVKTWRLENVGSCTWSSSYAAVFTGGDQMGAPAVINLPSSVPPGATVDLSVNLTAPSSSGHYRGNWMLRNDSGGVFGVGASGNSIFWVDIYVSGTYTGGTTYDFMANACSATWSSGAGTLPCPGTDGNSGGFVLPVTSPQLEDGTTDSNPGLVVNPQQVSGGYIQGVYPAYTVQSGDHFQGIVNCTYNSSSCYVNFRLMYQIGSGPVQTYWSFNERYDGLYYRFNLDLTPLAGQSVNFILYTADVSGYGVPSGDRAEWAETKIAGNGSVSSGGSGSYYPYYPSTCNRGYFVSDVTIPDRTAMAPGATFTKTWEIRNVGSCTWTTSYALVYVYGNPLGASSPLYLPVSVPPGATADFSVNMVAPNTLGHYRSYWRFQDASGNQFGVGSGRITFFADIYVSNSGQPGQPWQPWQPGQSNRTLTTTTITAHSPNPSTPGQTVAVSVTVSGSGTTPTGSVAITGADSNCTITLAAGSGSCNVVFNSNGNRTINAVYTGDWNNAGSSSSVIHTVTTATTPSTTSITGNTPNPSTPGQLVAVTVTVSGSSGTPTGTVAITGADGNCTITLTAGSGTCNVSFNSTGSKTLTASYSGSASYAGSSTTASQTVSKGPTTTLITANTPNPASTGQAVTVSASVSGLGPTPTGTVSISGADTNCTFSLASGSGSCNSVVFNTTGSKTITATYSGDGNYNGSSGTASETVIPAKLVPTVTITGDAPDPSTPGVPVQVGVSVASTGVTPTGTVAITGANTNCTITLLPSAPSTASGNCNVVFNSTGAKTITASYSGDSNYTTGSDTESHTVTPGPSTTTITSPGAAFSFQVGQQVPVSVTVTGLGGTPTGTVTIMNGTNLFCTITLAGGSGSCNGVFNNIGSPALTANYMGDMNYAGSSSVTVNGTSVAGTSVTSITSETPDPSNINENVDVIVHVTGGGATPLGTVTITSLNGGGNPTCNFPTIGGTGHCNLVYTGSGSFTITATFTGDPNYNTSSATASHSVAP